MIVDSSLVVSLGVLGLGVLGLPESTSTGIAGVFSDDQTTRRVCCWMIFQQGPLRVDQGGHETKARPEAGGHVPRLMGMVILLGK